MYIISSHVYFNKNKEENYGPAHSIFDFLISKKQKVIFIKHSLNSGYTEILSSLTNKKKVINIKINFLLFRSFKDFIVNFYYIFINSGKDLIYIGVDPLNGLNGCFSKKIKFIYFTADYSDSKFNNKFLNKIYYFIDTMCLKKCFQVWNVSSRICEKRLKQGVDNKKVKFVPNSPDLQAIGNSNYIKSKDLVLISSLTNAVDIEFIVNLMKKLNKYNLKLNIIGTGDCENYFKKIIADNNLSNFVIFLGQKTHQEVVTFLKKSFIGIAFYTDKNNFNYYGDSMKIREYVACGLPVVSNDIPSNAADIEDQNLGIVVKDLNNEIDKIVSFFINCLQNEKFYLNIKNNCFNYSKKYDKYEILIKLLFKN